MVNIDITLFIQLVNFLIILVVMNYLLIAPVRKIIKQRRDLASGLLKETEQFNADASGKLDGYENLLAKTREEATASREEAKAAALAREAAILAQAQQEAQEYLRDSRERTRAQVETAMAEMRSRIPALADSAAARLLGQQPSQSSGR